MSQTEVQLIKNDAVVTADIADDQVTLAKLSASGTPSSSTFLRGDNTFSALSGLGKLVQMKSATSGTDITTSSDADVSSGLAVTFTPSSASNICFATVLGGAQQGSSGSCRGAMSLYMDVGNGSGATFYGYIGAFQYNTANYVPHSSAIVTTFSGWPGSGTITATCRIREQGGNETYTFHDNEGGLSNNVYWVVMEIEP
tara:strand:+ start:17 stop:613 length:597 start_codon:yes stop_codon:yes gene_type:complete